MQTKLSFASIYNWINTHQLAAIGVVVLLLLLTPLVIGQSALMMAVFSLIFIYSLLTMGLMIITGYSGMLNMGHAAFYGVGAYTSAILALRFEQPYWVCILVAMLFTGLVGFLIAFPCLRVTTDFLSLITIAFGEVFLTIAMNWVEVTRGPMGLPSIPKPTFGNLVIDSRLEEYYYFLIIAVIVYLALRNILNSRVGRTLKAIRDDEICARAQGINVRYYKVLAFVLGTLPAGIAGSLIGGYIEFVGHAMFKFEASLLLMNMVILGGLGSLSGAVVGAAIFLGLTEIIRPLAVYRVGVGGAIMIFLMLFRPQGIMGSAAYAGMGGLQGTILRWRQRYLGKLRQATHQTDQADNAQTNQ